MIQGPYGENHPGRVEEGYPEDFDLYLDMYRHAVDNDLSDPDHYAGMTEKLDIMSYIDFNVVFIYLGNVDWLRIKAFPALACARYRRGTLRGRTVAVSGLGI